MDSSSSFPIIRLPTSNRACLTDLTSGQTLEGIPSLRCSWANSCGDLPTNEKPRTVASLQLRLTPVEPKDELGNGQQPPHDSDLQLDSRAI